MVILSLDRRDSEPGRVARSGGGSWSGELWSSTSRLSRDFLVISSLKAYIFLATVNKIPRAVNGKIIFRAACLSMNHS